MKKQRNSAVSTRESLLDQALTLFSQHGYSATGVRDIIQAAGVTQPTLYYHFADKRALFNALIDRYYGESQRQLEQILKTVSGCEYCSADPRVPRLMFQTYHGPRLPEIDGILDGLSKRRFRLVTRIMKEGIAEGRLGNADPEFLSLSFCCLMDQPINLFSRRAEPGRYLTSKLAEALVTLFLHGSAGNS